MVRCEGVAPGTPTAQSGVRTAHFERYGRRAAERPTARRRLTASGSTQPFVVLKQRQYLLLFVGTTLAMLAFGMMQVAQGVVAFDLTGKNGAVGFVFLGQGISMLLLSPVGGTLSDRVSKKRLLTSAQFVIGLMFALIATLIATGVITILMLAGASLVLG